MGLYADWILPWLCDLDSKDPALHAIRRDVLRDVSGRVLEIGFGTGANLPFYRASVRRLTVVEPSRGMGRRARRRLDAWGGEVELHALAGERLPFEDGSFDTVAMTLTLCSAAEPSRILAEIRRVLRPGGGYHFLEHVVSGDAVTRKWQRRLDGLSRRCVGGCSLLRDSESAIDGGGFRFERIERGLLPGGGVWVSRLFPAIWGRAVAEE
jgi:SAM-dependent methyltransferase